MKVFILLALLSVAVALPRPEVQLVDTPNAEIPDGVKLSEQIFNVAHIAETIKQKLENFKVAPIPAPELEKIAPAVPEIVRVVNNAEPNVNELDEVKIIDGALPIQELKQEKVQVVEAPTSPIQETVKVVESADNIVDDKSNPTPQEKVQVVDHFISSEQADIVKVVNNFPETNVDKVQVVDQPLAPELDVVHFVDHPETNVETVAHDKVLVDQPLAPELDVVHFVDQPVEVYDHVHVIVVDTPEIQEALQKIVDLVHFVNSPEENPRGKKYPNPLLR